MRERRYFVPQPFYCIDYYMLNLKEFQQHKTLLLDRCYVTIRLTNVEENRDFPEEIQKKDK